MGIKVLAVVLVTRELRDHLALLGTQEFKANLVYKDRLVHRAQQDFLGIQEPLGSLEVQVWWELQGLVEHRDQQVGLDLLVLQAFRALKVQRVVLDQPDQMGDLAIQAPLAHQDQTARRVPTGTLVHRVLSARWVQMEQQDQLGHRDPRAATVSQEQLETRELLDNQAVQVRLEHQDLRVHPVVLVVPDRLDLLEIKALLERLE